MVKLFNYANAFLGLLICICKIQENECSLCKIEVNGYGNDDPNGRQVYFKLNNEIAYIRAEFLGNLGSEVRGFHLAFVNIRNCSLIIEPVVCDTFYQAAGSNCVVNYIGQFSNTMEDVFLLLATGDAYELNLYDYAKLVLRPLGIPEYHLSSHRHSIALVAIPGCHNIGAVFSEEGNGPSNLHLEIQDTLVSKIECGYTCVQSECTSLTYSNGQCIRHMMENYNGMINENDNYRVTVFEQSCSNIFYKN